METFFSCEWSDSMSVDRSGYPAVYLFDLWIMVSSFVLGSSALLWSEGPLRSDVLLVCHDVQILSLALILRYPNLQFNTSYASVKIAKRSLSISFIVPVQIYVLYVVFMYVQWERPIKAILILLMWYNQIKHVFIAGTRNRIQSSRAEGYRNILKCKNENKYFWLKDTKRTSNNHELVFKQSRYPTSSQHQRITTTLQVPFEKSAATVQTASCEKVEQSVMFFMRHIPLQQEWWPNDLSKNGCVNNYAPK